MNNTESKRDVYTIVTEQIILQLEKGIVPWRQPWTDAGTPQNFVSHRPYRGLNVWLFASLGFERNFFLTYKQLNHTSLSSHDGWRERRNK